MLSQAVLEHVQALPPDEKRGLIADLTRSLEGTADSASDAELAHALAWYEMEAPNQVGRFLDRYDAAAKDIANNPFLVRDRGHGLRHS